MVFMNGSGPAIANSPTFSTCETTGRLHLPAFGKHGKVRNRSRVESCTLLTTVANELVRPIHDRMPAILAAADYAQWLDAAVEEPKRLASLLGPYASEAMAAFPVGPRVNSPANDDPGCIEPAAG